MLAGLVCKVRKEIVLTQHILNHDTSSVHGLGPSSSEAGIKWRIQGDDWRGEHTGYNTVLHVAGRLLSIDPANARRLSGDDYCTNVHPTRCFPERSVDGYEMRLVPGHPEYLLCPYRTGVKDSARSCEVMGERCGVDVEVDDSCYLSHMAFRKMMVERIGLLPGQEEWNREETQYIDLENYLGDKIGITIRPKHSQLRLYIKVDNKKHPKKIVRERTQELSKLIEKKWAEQVKRDASYNEGRSYKIDKQVTDNEHEWPEAVYWIMEHYIRLRKIAYV